MEFSLVLVYDFGAAQLLTATGLLSGQSENRIKFQEPANILLQTDLPMMYNTQSNWVRGLCESSVVLTN
jgi:hypothetical protein